MSSKKIYFISDAHLGTPNHDKSLVREKLLVQLLDNIKLHAEEIYFVGDLFDFWFEYNTVIPKGFTRILGKLAEISDAGIPVHFFTGNHDVWMRGYFEKELNIPVYHVPVAKTLKGKKFYIAHGDGLGPGDHGYKFLKKVFRNRFCQLLFRWLHPDIGIAIADFWSKRSRYVSQGGEVEQWKGDDKEWLVLHSYKMLEQEHFDYFVYGHRHFPKELLLNETSRYINLGDWLTWFTYAEFDGEKMEVKNFK